MVACGSRRSHSWAGYLGSDDQIPAINWYLKVWVDIYGNEYVGEQACNGYFYWGWFSLGYHKLRYP